MESPKRLYRSKTERMIGGVCGGLAHYFNIDPTLVRLVFVLTMLVSIPSPLIYLMMWIIMPEEP